MYSPKTKILATPNTNTTVMSASQKLRTGKLIPKGTYAPRIAVSVANFVELIGHGFETNNISDLTVWVPEEFLPAGIIPSSRKTSTKQKQGRTVKKITATPTTSAKEKSKGKEKGKSLLDIDFHNVGSSFQSARVLSPEPSYAYTTVKHDMDDRMEGPSCIPDTNKGSEVIEIEYTESDEEVLDHTGRSKKARTMQIITLPVHLLSFTTPEPHLDSKGTSTNPFILTYDSEAEADTDGHLTEPMESSISTFTPSKLIHLGTLDLTDD